MARGRHPTRIQIDPPDEKTAVKYLFRWSGRDLRHEPQWFPCLTSPELFGNDRPLEVDFGCGTGVLALSRAKHNPKINMLGIDLSQKPLYCAIRDAMSENLENIKFVRGNFSQMIQFLRPQTISAAYYLFPNPPGDYYRARSNFRRRQFLQSLHTALVPQGRIHFATDEPLFFECMSLIVKNDLRYKTLPSEPGDYGAVTHYRRLWEEKGKSVMGFMIEKDMTI
jgi:tRNA (guanine-N7-)-methyltransferase